MNPKTLLTRGFTLIELLVVIAIIGILAAVVIGSLNDARSGGQNASIQQTMTSLRSQAELFYNRPLANGGGNFSYTGLCTAAATVTGLTAALNVVNGPVFPAAGFAGPAVNNAADALLRRAACVSNSSAYQMTAPLAQGVGFWCVDSVGNARQLTNPPAAIATVCPAI